MQLEFILKSTSKKKYIFIYLITKQVIQDNNYFKIKLDIGKVQSIR